MPAAPSELRAAARAPRQRLADALAVLNAREREVRDTLWLLASLVWVLLPMVTVLPFWASLATAGLLLWRAVLTWTGRRLPARWVLIVLMLAGGAAVLARYHTILGKDAGVTYVVLLLGLKLLELRARRDIFVVIYLSLFIMLTSLFDSQSLIHALWLFLGVVLLTTAMVRVNFAANEPPLRVKLGLAAQICGLALPLMVALFVLFPRVEGPLWGMPGDAFAARSGLSDSMSPGSFDRLIESGDTAFQVEFHGRVPAPAERYWRGPVLGSFDGHTWRVLAKTVQNEPSPLEMTPVAGSAVAYTVTLEPTNRPFLYLLDAPDGPPRDRDLGPTLRPDLQVAVRTPVRGRTTFTARSFTRFRYGLNETPASLASALRLPRGSPRTRAFAAELLTQETDAHRLVTRILLMFRSGNYFYTTHPPLLGDQPVDEFLFDSRRGFCEHYAGAFVVLMRALNVPARVVTGYQGGDINPVNGQMTIRQSDAHAWAEVWFADTGWTRVDPTAAVAPERIERGYEQGVELAQGLGGAFSVTSRGWLRYVQYNLEALNNTWNRWIISYTGEEQRGLFRNWGFPEIDWQGLAVVLIAVFAVIGALLTSQVILRRPRLDPLQALYSRLCDQLGRRGVERRPNEGPRDYLARVTPTLDEPNLAKVRRAFALYEVLRYGRSPETPTELFKGFKTCVKSLRL
jgi:transglutaminase-like putative cysteine protease